MIVSGRLRRHPGQVDGTRAERQETERRKRLVSRSKRSTTKDARESTMGSFPREITQAAPAILSPPHGREGS